MSYIKLLYNGNIYGPLSCPSTLKSICQVLRISFRAMPCLQSLDRRDSKLVIIDSNQEIQSGFYELLANPDVEYDEMIDGKNRTTEKNLLDSKPLSHSPKPQLPKPLSLNLTLKSTVEVIHETISKSSEKEDDLEKEAEFPLNEREMASCLNAMMELISSIPPRYIKYNTKLSAQIDTALQEVEEWSKRLKETTNQSNSRETAVKVTFIQYR